MKKFALIPVLILLVSCTRQSLFCRVTLQLDTELPVVALKVDNSLAGNYFRNLNTGEAYAYPLLVNGKGELEVLKGVYVLSFDGVAALEDGTARRVRCTQYATAMDAVTLTGDLANVPLKIIVR